ncbi:MAG TPA: integron integrase [Burkholderiales bacterium]|jgi:integron integrase|nr:integron integrase [Burkholderiales bacterium]
MNAPDTSGSTKSLLLDRVRDKIRLKHYSIRTETAYVDWVRRFVNFHHRRHPRELGPEHVEAFLSHLAVQRNVAASTQNQAKSALLFLYKEVLGSELPWLENVESAKRPQRLPVVLTRIEVDAVLNRMHSTNGLIARLLYGSGLRLMEAARLRVKDVDLERCEIMVRDGKGAKDRVTMLPSSLVVPLRAHLVLVRELHAQDLAAGVPGVYLPYALDRKYPNAPREWGWQYVFPSKNRSTDPEDGVIRRHHLDESGLRRAVRKATREAGISKLVHCHTFRHSFATHLIESGYDIPPLEICMPSLCASTMFTF